MNELTLGFALCGSFCTFSKTLEKMRDLVEKGYHILPIMSYNASSTDTRFGKAEDIIMEIENISKHNVLKGIVDTEPIGPKKMIDLMIVAPCTGNTLAKLANGITDTPVTMAVKSALRIGTPIVLCVATNDALAASAQNIGKLLNTKNIYFVPMKQDDSKKKPNSIVADFDLILPTALEALESRQIQPIIF